jgi:hypothetical protein
MWTWYIGCGPSLSVGPPWICGGDDDVVHQKRAREQLRWSGPRRGGSRSERWLANSSLWVSLCAETMDMDRWRKGTIAAGGAPMTWCFG